MNADEIYKMVLAKCQAMFAEQINNLVYAIHDISYEFIVQCVFHPSYDEKEKLVPCVKYVKCSIKNGVVIARRVDVITLHPVYAVGEITESGFCLLIEEEKETKEGKVVAVKKFSSYEKAYKLALKCAEERQQTMAVKHYGYKERGFQHPEKRNETVIIAKPKPKQ